MKRRMREARNGWLLAAPLLAGCLVFFVVPLVLTVQYSLTGSGRDAGLGLENYRALLGNGIFRLAFGNTLRFLLVSLPLVLVLGYAIALLLKKHAKKYALLRTVLLFPYIMPVVGTVILVDLLFGGSGMVGQALAALGVPVKDLLGSPAAFYIAVGLYLWKDTGYAVILLLSGLVTIPDDHYAVAALDGATGFQQFRYITVPQMWYCVFFTVVFSLINAFKCFREIFLIGGEHPNASIYMLQHFINNSFQNLNYAKLSVASILLLVVLAVLFAVLYAWVMRKESYKG